MRHAGSCVIALLCSVLSLVRMSMNYERKFLYAFSSTGSCAVLCYVGEYSIIIFSSFKLARRAGSDGSMSASGSAGPGFNLGARRGGDVHFLIARLYITGLD